MIREPELDGFEISSPTTEIQRQLPISDGIQIRISTEQQSSSWQKKIS